MSADATVGLRLLNQREIDFVDGAENVLAPSNEVAPDTDVICKIGKPISPGLEDKLQV